MVDSSGHFRGVLRQNQTGQVQRNLPPHGIRGEVNDMPSAAPAALLAAISTNTPPKNKHPKPASVQRRMVQAELVALGQSNDDGATLPAGTAGTAGRTW